MCCSVACRHSFHAIYTCMFHECALICANASFTSGPDAVRVVKALLWISEYSTAFGSAALTTMADVNLNYSHHWLQSLHSIIIILLPPVVDPQIMLSFDPEVPTIGEPFTSRCVATIDSGVSGSIQFEWRDTQNQVISNSTGEG